VIYVFDSSALIGILLKGPDHGSVYNRLTDFVNSDQVCFCDDVLVELERLARNEPPHIWAKAVAKSRCHKDAAYKHKMWTAQQAPDLIDLDAEFGSAAAVLAQARELISLQQKTRVVTEDINDKPTRAALAVVCRRLNIPVMRLQECLAELGIVTTTSPGA
jgi:hypothetical protein